MTRCTGLAASWCPVHGDCCCPCGDQLPSGVRGELNDPRCPLHAPTSTHPEPSHR
jgi:hypothetical protein